MSFSPWRIMTSAVEAALFTAAEISLLIRKLAPEPADLVAGAVHFRKGTLEFQQAFNAVFFGTGRPSAEEQQRERESKRIRID